jgi:muramidase (phage lysozyme)
MLDNANVRKFLDFLGKAEGADYNVIVGGSKFEDFTKHPNIVGLRTKEGPSTAAGKYQITNQTYRDFAPKLGITDFSPESQDRIAVAIMERHGALQDVVKGDYNAAIGKLGGRWASLPSSPYSQPKKSQEWVNAMLGTEGRAQVQLPPLQGALKNPNGFQPAMGPSQEEILLAGARTDAKYGGVVNTVKSVPGALADAFETENYAVNIFRNIQVEKHVDPDFRWDAEFYSEMTKDIGPDNHGHILAATSREDAARRRARLLDHKEKLEEQARRGGVGITATFLAAALDLPTAAAIAVPQLGGAGLGIRASRVARAVQAGLAGAAGSAAVEAPLLQYRPMATMTDLYMSTLGGGVLSAAGGALRGGGRVLGEQEAALARMLQTEHSRMVREELEQTGHELTPTGRALLDPARKEAGLVNPLEDGLGKPLEEGVLKDINGNGAAEVKPRAGQTLMVTGDAVDSLDFSGITAGQLKALKASAPSDPTLYSTARTLLAEALGEKAVASMESLGRLKIVARQSDLPESLRHEMGVNGFYDPITDTTFILADRLNKDNARGFMLHEAGVHQGLERIVGTTLYNKMLREVDRLAAAGDKRALEAIEKARKSPSADFLKGEEKLAYLVQAMGKEATTVFRKVLAKIKAFLIKRFGTDLELTDADLLALVEGSMKKVMTDKKFGSRNGLFPYVWAGSPARFTKFSNDFIGTGEGNVMQGFGIYASADKFVGNWYRLKETAKRGMTPEEGGLYQIRVVDADIDEFMRWDSQKQSRTVRDALKRAGIDAEGKTGKDIYMALLNKMEGDTPKAKAKAASEFLYKAGIKGNRYATGASKNKGASTDNFVFFQDRNLDISTRYSVGDATADEVADFSPAATNAAGKKGFSLGLSYENFFSREWVPAQARDLFHKLSGTTTGYKDHSVVEQSAQDHKLALAGGWEARLSKAYKSAFREFLDDQKIPFFKQYDAYRIWNAQVGVLIRDPSIEGAHPSVVKMANEARALMRDVVDHFNNPAKFNGGEKRGLTQEIEIDENGVEGLTKPLDYNDAYFPRSPVGQKFAQVAAQFGEEMPARYFSNAFKRLNPDATDAVAQRFGKWYVNKIVESRIDRRYVSTEDMLLGVDRDGLKESFMQRGGMSDVEAQELMDFMFQKNPDAQKTNRNLKRRSQFDENYEETIVLPDGSTHKLGYADFFETDTIGVLQNYLNRSAGSVALANAVGVYKKTDIDKLIGDATSGGLTKYMDPSRQDKVRQYLKDQFDNLMGIPAEGFTPLNKSMQMIRDFNVARLMGKAVFNQIQESSQIAGEFGLKTMLQTVPQLRRMIRDVKTGSSGNEMLDQLENLTGGAGADLLRRNDFQIDDEWVRELGDTKFNRWLDGTAAAMQKSASGVLKYTGMSGLMVLQKRTHALAMINHFVEAGLGTKKLAYTPDRLAWMGLDQPDVDAVLAGMKKYHTPVKDSKTGKVDFERWHQEDPRSLAKFVVAFQRNSRRAVQENDIASSIPILGKGWAKTIFQFMNFAAQAWGKSLQFAWNHRDYQTLMTVMYGMLFSTAAYTARTRLEMIGMSAEEKERFAEERLSVKQIVMNSAARMQQASLLPNILDTAWFGSPLFSGAKTTSNATDFIGGNPTFGAINTAVGFLKKSARNSMSDEYQTTEQDMRSYFRMMMFNNVLGISNLLNAVAADYPSNENQQ